MIHDVMHRHAELGAALVVVLGFWDLLGTVFSWLAGHIADVATAIAGAIAAVWQTLLPIFRDVWKVVRPIWTTVLRPFWDKVSGWFQALKSWWTEWAKPVTDLFKHIAAFERAIYNATIGPILDTISNLQKLLTVLHLSHTALGAAVDRVLTHAEGTINIVYQTLSMPVNQIIQVIEGYILDVNGFLSADLLVGSVARNFTRIWSAWWTVALPAISPEGKRLLESLRALPPLHQERATFRQAILDRAGPTFELGTEGRALFRIILEVQEPEPPHWDPLR